MDSIFRPPEKPSVLVRPQHVEADPEFERLMERHRGDRLLVSGQDGGRDLPRRKSSGLSLTLGAHVVRRAYGVAPNPRVAQQAWTEQRGKPQGACHGTHRDCARDQAWFRRRRAHLDRDG